MTPSDPIPPPRVLLIVGGGIAAYKALELTRLLRKAGVEVTPVLTAAGAQFVTPLSLSALAEQKTYQDLWSLTDEAEMGHIELSRAADLIVVAPATADLMAKAANGLADDLASTILLATNKAVLMAPAMNVRMWLHPATQRNVARLQADGVAMVGPDEGAMACGEFGPGRMSEPEAILSAALALLQPRGAGAIRMPPPPSLPPSGPLAGRRVLVTAGPTHEPLDPVRYIANRSSGRQGYAVAAALARRGAEVTLVSGPVELPAPAGVTRVQVETAEAMLAACRAALPVEVAVMVAAVADWRPERATDQKLKKDQAGEALRLVPNPDILAELSRPGPCRPRLVVGFAAETEKLETHARDKLVRKGCDWIVANDVSQAGVMGGQDNEVTLITREGVVERWPRLSKAEVAERLADRIAAALRAPAAADAPGDAA